MPFKPESLQGWHLGANQQYHSLEPDARGWLWCATLGYWLGTWEGTIDRETAVWLRFYDAQGHLVLLPEEAAQQQAEIAQQQAEIAQQEIATTQYALAAERQRAEALATRLRELGLDPDV